MSISSNNSDNSIISSISESIDQINLNEFRNNSLFSGIDGAGSTIVILDTGIDLDHPLFGPDNDGNGVSDRIVYSYDFSGENDPDASDTNDHGSNVSSIAAAMASGANIIHLKVFPDGNNPVTADGDIREALDWVVQNAERFNIASVNMSLGGGEFLTERTAHSTDHAQLKALYDAGIAVIAAAGNYYAKEGSFGNQGVAGYAADPYTIAVGAVTKKDQLTDFSQRGKNVLDILAPGTDMDGANSNGGTVIQQGTSQAAPHIAGVAALAQQLAVRELGRRLTVEEFRQLLKTTGVTINDGEIVDEGVDVPNSGESFKRVDVVGLGEGILTGRIGVLPTDQNDTLTGTGQDDRISAFEGDDTLDGNSGNDVLIGGTGADTFVFKSVNEGSDTIQDFNQQEGDKIQVDVTAEANQFRYDAQTGQVFFNDQAFVTLANSPEFDVNTDLIFSKTEPPVEKPPVEKPPVNPEPPIVLPPSATEGDDVLTSNSDQGVSIFGLGGNDRITGGAGNDTLDGGAGDDVIYGGAGNDSLNGQAGSDTMEGGLGDDIYTVDSNADVIIEAIDQGNDSVLASTGYVLSENIENLALIGSDAIDGRGNSLDNIITGNAANNYLYAGDGADQVSGEAGDDYLYGEAGDDLLNGGEGIDWLVGDLGDDILSGGAGNDRLLGGLGNDTLSGDEGKARLTGGADADRFVLNALDKPFDIITDFKATQGDKIVFSAAGVNKPMKGGKLPSTRFTLGSTAEHEKAGFVYDKASGRLFFDVDGIGGQKQTLIAKLAAETTLSHNNILVSA